jgi:N-methylhydantoinase A
MSLDAARDAIYERVAKPLGYTNVDDLDAVASGILEMATATMAGAIKEITVERGLDVREFDLFVFGGGGPLHSATLARELHIPRVIVPPQPGNFSALGMLLAASRIDDTRTFLNPLSEAVLVEMLVTYEEMERAIAETIHRESQGASVRFERVAELRYRGQKHSLRIDIGSRSSVSEISDLFHSSYLLRYGHSDPRSSIEFVALRSTGYANGDAIELSGLHNVDDAGPPKPGSRLVYYNSLKRRVNTSVYSRSRLPLGFSASGPAIIEDYGSTIVVEPEDRFAVGSLGEITIHCD